SSIQEYLDGSLEESKNVQLTNLALSLKDRRGKAPSGEEERSLAVSKTSRLKDRLSFGNRGYYLRKYPPSKFYPKGLEKWIIWWEEDGKRRTETVNHAVNANEVIDYLEHKRRQLFDKSFCCPSCGYNLKTGEQEAPSTSHVTLKQAIEEFLKTKRKKKSFGVIANRLDILGRYLKDINRIADLTLKRVYKLKAQMEENNYRGSTINAYLKMLKGLLNFAKDMKYIEEVIPVSKAKADMRDSRKRRFVPHDKFWKIYDKVKSQYLKDMLLIGRTCANRPGELMTLKWNRVELNGDGSHFYIPPDLYKTGKEKYCSLIEEVRPIFYRLKREKNGSEFVFIYNGKPIAKNRYSQDLRQANINAGIEEKSYDFYEMCRHSGITDKGHEPEMSIGELMTFAGHTNPGTTARYLHSMEGKNQAVTREEITRKVKR
ncbi:MAG: tyrosine-type recombinase/integrase, partial [Nitrospirota bacterium]|nr:tyrosine-type recombinase/integrase [Nitrospirota bacterium]